MFMQLWNRLSIRAQAIIAVVLPVLVVALYTSVAFPRQINSALRSALEQQATAVVRIGATSAVPTMRLVNDGLAELSETKELDIITNGVRAMNDVTSVGLLVVSPQTTQVGSDGVVRVAVSKANRKVQPVGDLPDGDYVVPELKDPKKPECLFEFGNTIVVRCVARDEAFQGMLVAVMSRSRLDAEENDNVKWGLVAMVVAGLLGLLLAIMFSKALAGPLGSITRVAQEVAGGDVSLQRVEASGAGEVRSLARSVNDMLRSIRSLVNEMVALSGKLSGAAQGLLSASNDQETVTSQQSAYAQEIAATFEELSRTAEKINQSTDVVEYAAVRTAEAVEEAKSVVGSMVGGINDIRRESKEVADAILKLNSDLQQVSRIAQVINQVADRSDLLALNAALEGTKAGEVGRGFSLVAAEMRKLAESVAGSSRDISRLVEQVKASGEQAVTKARQGVEASDKGVQVAEKASAVFEQIVEFSRGTKDAAQQISVATRQQKQSSEQAVQGARNVADLVKQGVDATGRTNRIAQDLQHSVAALTELTGRFKVS